MGTTSDKLTYLNTTKQKLKDSINALGGDITSETTFRNYATELDNIYDSLPKTTGEGSNLSLSTIKGRINVDDILGDTEQDSTTGKNVLQCRIDIAIGQTASSNGITWKRTGENTWVFNGTATADFTLVIGATAQLEAHIVNGQTYTLSGCPTRWKRYKI